MDFVKKWYKHFKIYYKDDNSITDDLVKISIRILKGIRVPELICEKKAKGRKVYRIAIKGDSYYLKLYNYRRKDKIVKNTFRPAEGSRALKMAMNLINKDIPVVEPVVTLTKHSDFFIKDSIFITKVFEGKNLKEYFTSEEYDENIKGVLINKIAYLWAVLYNNKIINGDPNLESIMLKKYNNQISLAFVDLDNFRQLIYFPRKLVLENLVSFNSRSYAGLKHISKNMINTRDRLFFFKSFLKYYKFNNIKGNDYKYIAGKTVAKLREWDIFNQITKQVEKRI